MRRMLVGMSQEKLGDALGLTFQQVQKYEKGTNRIGASRLQHISDILNVKPAFFFDDMPGAASGTAGFAEDGSSGVVDFLSSSDGLLLNKAFAKIKSAKVRRKIVDLVVALADQEGEAKTATATSLSDALPVQE
ncbi:helix-turn-helix domain-containing protein [Lichenihabitans sp. PAMC28606]|uniref:helix-turn-helix domain-containing protein n=1 Tax=Lichenihabitans sp. PAMC28606 TaxID=2880932 RepID=UPI00222335BC|nr:helix-turn-helix transcriptional regulator [Lichenihabitans sp. PAMC28606]